MPPVGRRCAFVRFNAPISVTDALGSFAGRGGRTVRELTDRVEVAVQEGVDALNAANPYPGGRLRVAAS